MKGNEGLVLNKNQKNKFKDTVSESKKWMQATQGPKWPAWMKTTKSLCTLTRSDFYATHILCAQQVFRHK